MSMLALALAIVCLYPAARFIYRCDPRLPTVALFCGMHAFMFTLPALTNPHVMPDLVPGPVSLSGFQVSHALAVCILAMITFQLSYFRLRSRRWMARLPVVTFSLDERRVVAYCLVVASLGLMARDLERQMSLEYQIRLGAITSLLDMQMLVAVVLLAALAWNGRGNRWAAGIVMSLVGLLMLRGFADLFLERALIPAIVLLVARWAYTRRVPILTVLFLSVIFAFLSPVKSKVRDEVGRFGEFSSFASPTQLKTAWRWVSTASEHWNSDSARTGSLTEANSTALKRIDLVHQLAYIISKTPSDVQYQRGKTYRYLVAAPIPRALWSEKPQVGDANRFYALEYEVTDEKHSRTTTFGVSLLGEAYINLGVAGVILLMMILGTFFAIAEHVLTRSSSTSGHAIWIAFVVPFVTGIGYSAELFLGNALQMIFGSLLILFLFFRIGRRVNRVTGEPPQT